MTWRLVVAALATLIVAAIVLAFSVGFGSNSSAKPAPATSNQTHVTAPDCHFRC
jgi:hypothetical protein